MATKDSTVNDQLEFMKLVGNLKHLKRTGWVKKGINEPETVSGHMYRMAILSFFFGENEGFDSNKVMRMSLVHDLGESIIGDITPHCGVSKEEKHCREVEAMNRIKSLVDKNGPGQEMFDLFMEYEEQKTKEAQLVMDLDRFDMILQAFEYEEKEKSPKVLEEFFTSTEGFFKTPKVIQWVEELKKQRSNFSLSSEKGN
ncbi:HD domain-containing protein 2 [Armadillidium nasatum]|uniref:5'-deoxynucleotidase HDDC2 n=1 Tax=Armadillidium nasatum TaxID=96803 RepID=A0A5N5SVH0_9CRUS|nr:HD domain-containing protein 2 [Armadillidium nasatum]